MILDIMKIMDEIKVMFPFLEKNEVLNLAIRTYSLAKEKIFYGKTKEKIFYGKTMDNKINLTQN